jgi:hypothetical protein
VRHDLLTPTNASFRNVYAKLDHLSEDDNLGLGADAAHTKRYVPWAATSNHPARPEAQHCGCEPQNTRAVQVRRAVTFKVASVAWMGPYGAQGVLWPKQEFAYFQRIC